MSVTARQMGRHYEHIVLLSTQTLGLYSVAPDSGPPVSVVLGNALVLLPAALGRNIVLP